MVSEIRGRMIVAIVSIMAAQSITALIWAGAAAERLAHLEQRMDRTQDLIERTARLEEQTSNIRLSLIRIERKLDDVYGDGR